VLPYTGPCCQREEPTLRVRAKPQRTPACPPNRRPGLLCDTTRETVRLVVTSGPSEILTASCEKSAGRNSPCKSPPSSLDLSPFCLGVDNPCELPLPSIPHPTGPLLPERVRTTHRAFWFGGWTFTAPLPASACKMGQGSKGNNVVDVAVSVQSPPRILSRLAAWRHGQVSPHSVDPGSMCPVSYRLQTTAYHSAGGVVVCPTSGCHWKGANPHSSSSPDTQCAPRCRIEALTISLLIVTRRRRKL
jgi:hypothetical protein